jgi:hypothetical protein
MLTQANHWLEIVGTVVDVILLGRVLLLRLYRLYLFITLALVLSVFFDAVALWLDPEPKTIATVFIYSRFLYAFVFPLIAWDVFEEVKEQVAKIRRLAIARLISGLVFACVFGFIIAVLADTTDQSGDSAVFVTIALIFWAGSSTATLAFLWTLHRQIRTQKLELPNNTYVWMLFWELSLLLEVLSCFWVLAEPLVKTGDEYVQLAFNICGIALAAWCVVKLRAIPASLSSASANADL